MRPFPFFLFILLLAPCYAFYAELQPLQTQITPGQEARYQLTLHNDQEQEDTYLLSTRNPEWILSTEPALAQIPSKSTFRTTLLLKPRSGATLGSQTLLLSIRSQRTPQTKEEKLTLQLQPTPEGGLYEAKILLGVDVPKEHDPREKIPIRIHLRNQNPLNISSAQLEISGELFSKEQLFNLKPEESKTFALFFELNPKQKPDSHILIVRVSYRNQTIAENKKLYHISAYPEIEEHFNLEKGFLKTQQTFSVHNHGNAPHFYTKEVRYSFYLKPFIQTQPEPTSAHGKWKWQHTLQAEENYTLTINQNYRPLLYLLTLALLSIIGYYLFRSPIVAHKEAIPEDHSEEHNESSQFKVRLLLVNRSGKTLHHLRVIDKVPSMAQVTQKHQQGILSPHKPLTTEKKDTLLIWEIDGLEPYEERLITYRIKSKLRLYGGIHLPATKIKYETKKGKERKAYSNAVRVFSKRKE